MNDSSSPAAPTLDAMALTAIPPALEAHRAVQGPLRRLRAVEARLEAAAADHAEIRRETVAELLSQGLSYAQIGKLIGVTKSRAFQIAKGL